MAHDIENNEMAYVGRTPWHGLGIKLEPGATAEQMLKAAKLDWQVVTQPTFTILDNKPLETGYQAVIRQDTGQCFGMARGQFTPVQNTDTLHFFDQFCESGDLTLETVGAVRGGEYVWALAKINDGKIDIDNDILNNYLLIANSHCPGHSMTIKSTMIRVVCNNTLTFALRRDSKTFGRFVHNRSIYDQIEQAKDYVQAALDNQRLFASQMEKLIERSISNMTAEEFLTEKLEIKSDGKVMGKIMGLFNGKQRGGDMDTVQGNAWGLLNAVTEHIDHRVGDADARLRSAWFGRGEKVKQRVFKGLLELDDA